MTTQYCSDLHIEYPENYKYMTKNPIPPLADVLVMAGDIVSFSALSKRQAFFDVIAARFKMVYWIPGNHEYYDADISERSGSFQEKIRDNVWLVNNSSFVHGQTKIVFSTLWSEVNDLNKWKVENYISDFKAIRIDNKPFTVTAFNVLHQESLAYLTAELGKDWSGHTVVVTHHVPTFLHYPKKYKGDPLNEVFASEQHALIEKTKPNYWIYGHHHCNTPPFFIGTTQLVTNQLGYVHHYEHGSFDNTKLICQ